ncbi:Ras guanine nucleotide exchange factor [Reticulomyxa filosa]|uniref:Ras guanine nucleotide exchange factor n=1 Tax=Reticulomyxa filosa TaxID=46433 RepID=X6M8E6_RETFI|nr:Ras guanine nucleotide exchange factor [Reticulomyxa filosa]|eukprot:ETO09747.1 Ras guanine nucleotide exchange factor [Reticulomyxa filosa]
MGEKQRKMKSPFTGHRHLEREKRLTLLLPPFRFIATFISLGKKKESSNNGHNILNMYVCDFVRILNYIDSNLNDQAAGIKLFDDLRKVAKRLLRGDNKYRVLDLRNPIVRSRLLGVEGVDAYLKYLGFEEHPSTHKMVCPENQPAKSIIKAAMEVCDEFKERAKDYRDTVEGMRRQSQVIQKEKDSDKTKSTEGDTKSTTLTTQTTPGTSKDNSNDEIPGEQKEKEKETDEYTIRQMVFQITNPESRDDKTQDHIATRCVYVLLIIASDLYNTNINNIQHIIYNIQYTKPKKKNAQHPLILNEKHSDLLRTMVERFEEAGEEWQIRLKIGNMLRQWIRNFYADDFVGENGCLDMLDKFLETLESSEDSKVQKLAKTISQSLEQQDKDFEKKQTQKERQPRRNLIAQMGAPSKFKFSEADPRIVAEQISLMDFKLFKVIQKRECLGQAWKKKDRDKRAPNVMAMIEQFNKVSKWIQVLILTAPSLRERTKVLKNCVLVAGVCDVYNTCFTCRFERYNFYPKKKW